MDHASWPTDLYALLVQDGLPDEQARLIADTIATYERRLATVERKIDMLSWMQRFTTMQSKIDLLTWLVPFSMVMQLFLLWRVLTK